MSQKKILHSAIGNTKEPLISGDFIGRSPPYYDQNTFLLCPIDFLPRSLNTMKQVIYDTDDLRPHKNSTRLYFDKFTFVRTFTLNFKVTTFLKDTFSNSTNQLEINFEDDQDKVVIIFPLTRIAA